MSHFNLPSIASVGWTANMTDRTVLDPGGRVCHPVSYDESTETVRVRYPSGSTETWLAKHVTLYLLAEPTPQPGALRTLEEWESAPTNTTVASTRSWLLRVATRQPSGEWIETGSEMFYTTSEIRDYYGDAVILHWGCELDI